MSNPSEQLHAHMNNTKWCKLRNAMYRLGDLSPKWRTLDLNGYKCPWDSEWYYHFVSGGFKNIEYIEIKVSTQEMRDRVREELVKIHVPGRETKDGFIVFGYTHGSEEVDYIHDL